MIYLIYIGAAARRILEAAAHFIPAGVTFPNAIYLRDLEPLQVGPFEITPYLIDHSAYDAYAFLVADDKKRLFYTGDLRAHGAIIPPIDLAPYHLPRIQDYEYPFHVFRLRVSVEVPAA